MKPLWQGVLSGVVAYLFFMVVTAPAVKVLPLVQPEGVRATGVDGTLWSGRAARVAVPAVQLTDVRWRFRPLALFIGQVRFAIEGSLQGQRIEADAGSSFLGKPRASDVRGRMAASELLKLPGLQQVRLDGMLDFDISEVEWPDSGYPAVAGTVVWSGARVGAPYELELGKMQLETRIEDGVTRGTLKNEGGALLLQADVEMNSSGAYRLNARLQQKGDVPQAVTGFLTTFAEYKDGTYILEWSDSI
ncbi:MAG: type II secretion system protein N [Thiogranum sp.]